MKALLVLLLILLYIQNYNISIILYQYYVLKLLIHIYNIFVTFNDKQY